MSFLLMHMCQRTARTPVRLSFKTNARLDALRYKIILCKINSFISDYQNSYMFPAVVIFKYSFEKDTKRNMYWVHLHYFIIQHLNRLGKILLPFVMVVSMVLIWLFEHVFIESSCPYKTGTRPYKILCALFIMVLPYGMVKKSLCLLMETNYPIRYSSL